MRRKILLYIQNYLFYLESVGKRVYIKPKPNSAIRFGFVKGFKRGKIIVNIFDYGLWYEIEYNHDSLTI